LVKSLQDSRRPLTPSASAASIENYNCCIGTTAASIVFAPSKNAAVKTIRGRQRAYLKIAVFLRGKQKAYMPLHRNFTYWIDKRAWKFFFLMLSLALAE